MTFFHSDEKELTRLALKEKDNYEHSSTLVQHTYFDLGAVKAARKAKQRVPCKVKFTIFNPKVKVTDYRTASKRDDSLLKRTGEDLGELSLGTKAEVIGGSALTSQAVIANLVHKPPCNASTNK